MSSNCFHVTRSNYVFQVVLYFLSELLDLQFLHSLFDNKQFCVREKRINNVLLSNTNDSLRVTIAQVSFVPFCVVKVVIHLATTKQKNVDFKAAQPSKPLNLFFPQQNYLYL